MELHIIGLTQETTLICKSIMVRALDHYILIKFDNDNESRDAEDYIKKMGGKTKHRDKTICLTNPEDFTIEIL